jgi:hypothetical protein
MRYLATTRAGVAEHWYPKEPHERAQVDAVLDWHHLNIRKGSSEKAPSLWLLLSNKYVLHRFFITGRAWEDPPVRGRRLSGWVDNWKVANGRFPRSSLQGLRTVISRRVPLVNVTRISNPSEVSGGRYSTF